MAFIFAIPLLVALGNMANTHSQVWKFKKVTDRHQDKSLTDTSVP